MAKWTLTDGNRQLAEIDSLEKLEKALLDVPLNALRTNSIVDLTSPAGDTLSIGFAGELACANYVSASTEPPFLSVVGDEKLSESDGVIAFFYGGSESETLRRNCVPKEVAIRIARDFFKDGKLPQWIPWESV